MEIQSDEDALGIPKRRRVRERDLDGHFTQQDASGQSSPEPPPTRIAPSPDSPPGSGEDENESGDTAAVAEAARDIQLLRAVEILKSWSYFEDMRRLREQSSPDASDDQAVASAGNDD